MAEEIKYSAMNSVKRKFEFLHGQKAPCAVFIGFNTFITSPGVREVSTYNYNQITQIVELLRKNGIDAVPSFSELATNPAKTVVTAGGIQTPVLKADKLEDAAKQIFEALNPRTIRDELNGSYKGLDGENLVTCAPLEISQMLPIATTSKNIYSKIFEAGITHPDVEEFTALRQKYGFDLEYDLICEAEKQNLLLLGEIRKQNDTSLTSVYRGGCLGDNPYACFAARENKAFAYATPDIDCARMYSGLYGDYGVKLQASSSKDEGTKSFGLIYEMEASDQIALYRDYSIEKGYSPLISAPSKNIKIADWQYQNLETIVNPNKNKLKNVYLHLRKDGMDMFYPIPLKDKRWQAFLALYRSSDTCQRGYMIERRNRIIAEQKVYSSLNSTKKLGIFKAEVKPLDLTDLDREKAIKAANMTVEEKRLIATASQKNSTKQNLATDDIAAKIQALRCGKAQTSNIQATGTSRTVSKEILKYTSQNKKLYG